MGDNDEKANLIVSAVNEATQTLATIQKSFEDFEGSAGKLGITSVTLGNILSNVLQRAFSELKDMVKLGINEAIDAEQQQMKLALAFKAEGDAAQASVGKINAAADALGELVGIDNDVIVANAAVVRQLTGLSAEAINKAMPAIADLATRTGSLESASLLVARAINGQEMGLSRMGIQLDLTSDKGENLERVMGAINKSFGGQAQANMATTGGKLQNLKVVFTDVAQEIGNSVIQSSLFQDAVSLLTGTLLNLKSALDPEAGKKFQAALDKAARASRGLTEEVKATGEGINSALMQSADEREKAAIGEFRTRTGLADKELENTLKNLEIEVAAREQAIEQITALNERNKTDTSAPVIEPMTEEQIALIQSVELMIKETGDSVRVFYADIDETVSNEMLALQDITFGAIMSIQNSFGNLYLNLLDTSKSGHDKMVAFWKDLGANILGVLNQVIAKLIIVKAMTALFNAVGGTGLIADLITPFLGMQTPEGSTRLVPGPPNMPVHIIAHGGETIGRGGNGGGGGGMTMIIEGDYFESDEANAKLFERLHKYEASLGVA